MADYSYYFFRCFVKQDYFSVFLFPAADYYLSRAFLLQQGDLHEKCLHCVQPADHGFGFR